ncbi:hypothetical protein, partial [Dehalococcoides mccartyi]
ILAIPIYKPSNEEQGPIIEQVNQILSIVRDNGYPDNPAEFPEIMELEKQIDQMVYKLYGLTEEEKMVVEGKPQDD